MADASALLDSSKTGPASVSAAKAGSGMAPTADAPIEATKSMASVSLLAREANSS